MAVGQWLLSAEAKAEMRFQGKVGGCLVVTGMKLSRVTKMTHGVKFVLLYRPGACGVEGLQGSKVWSGRPPAGLS